jgi:hypothetical protein
VIAHTAGQWIRLGRIRHLMKVSLSEVLPWRALLSILGVALVAALLARLATAGVGSPLLRLLLGGPLFAAVYLGGVLWLDVIPDRERRQLDAWARAMAVWRRA